MRSRFEAGASSERRRGRTVNVSQRGSAVPALGLVALAAVAAMATVITFAATRADARDADRDAARLAADRFATSLTAVTASVSGVDALAVDGVVAAEEFEAFATDVAIAGGFPALAYVELVPGSDRTAWEAATGASMRDTDGAGNLVPAERRPTHAVVRFAAPVTETTRRVIGFDLMSDPVRARGIEAATDAEGAQLVGPISTVTGAQPGLFMASAVHDAADRVIGFVAVGISLDEAADQLSTLNGIGGVGVTMDGAPLLDRGHGPTSETFTLAGRTFTVYASAGRSSSWLASGLLAAATVAFGVAAARAVRSDRRDRARERRSTERSALLAAFAEDLVNVSSTRRTAQLAADHAGSIVGARHTNVGTPLATDPTKLAVVHDSGMEQRFADRFALQAIADELPLADAARTGTTVWVADRDDWAARYPQVVDEIVAAGIHAVCCVPLSLGSDAHAGVIGFAFDRPLTADDRAEIEPAATIISQMTGRALDRARVRELVQERVDLLADLARQLTTVRSSDDVRDTVRYMIPPLLELDSAELVHSSPPLTTDSTTRVYEPSGTDGAHLLLRHDSARVWASIDETLATTIADLVGGALSRTRLHDQERAVLERFQASLLMPPPDVDGFEIAVGYRSALAAVDMGGDWYSIIDTPDAIYAVIGDVAGHGPGAVALMAEVKTVMRHLLTTGTPIDQAVTHADHTLQRREAFASMLAVRIDKNEPCVEYINAGHLAALIYGSTGIVALDHVHRPWLGFAPKRPTTTTMITFEPDDLLLMYTDGLVEQRDELIDDSIRDRLHPVDRNQPAHQLVDELLADRQLSRNGATVDDDIAIIAIRRTASGRRSATTRPGG